MAELELSVVSRQCLARRIPARDEVQHEVAAWESTRNERQVQIRWRFTSEDARVKLQRLYPVKSA